VTLEFEPPFVRGYEQEREELFRKYKVDSIGIRKGSGPPPTPLEIHAGLKELHSRLSGNPKQLGGNEIPPGELEVLKDIVSKFLVYNFINNCKRSELSLVIALSLDDGAMLDIARFGEFAEPRP
jgi:hypothetical protein